MSIQAAADLQLSSRARLEILGAMLLALFLFALDQTIVGTALPVIVTDLDGNALYVWVVTAYLLTATISGPIYGKLSDLYGRRPVIIFAVSLFLIASVLSGLSQNIGQLILFRGLQGLGGGAIFPVALAVVADLYTPAERGKYLGLFGAVFGLSFLLGPAIGGIITDNFGWRWIFFVNVPIGLVSLVIIGRLLPAIKRPDAGRNIDYLGVSAFALAITLFLIGLTNKASGEWADPAVGGLILAGLAFGALFVWIESRAANPIVPLTLFRNRNFSVSVGAMFLTAFGFFGAVIFLPRWFQTVLGASATESGYSILPLLVGLVISAIASGQIVARTGRYKVLMLGSLILLAVGLFMMTNLKTDTDRLMLSLAMVLTGLGVGPSFAVFTLVVQNSVAPARIGVATGSLTFFQQIGGTIGLTLGSTVLASRLVEEIPIQLVAAGVPPPIVDGFAGGSGIDLTGTGDLGQRILATVPPEAQALIAPLIENIVAGIYEAFSIAIGASFYVGIVAAILAFVFVVFLREEPMRTTFDFEDEAPAEAEVEVAPG
ncbi:MAG: DHA2 family efflux MFS transporter permease subunit [Thermomicrobiales bacterium]|nr:MAG: DHA2 family efflux MFS transporter permease subunit [Thermomicrobiales bacterium]